MAELALRLPDGRKVMVNVLDGQQTVDVTIEECACGCEQWFQPQVPHQRFVNESHKIAFNSAKRPRKTKRAVKKK